MKKQNEHAAQAGEAGHQGPDRQPGNDIEHADRAAPDPAEAATGRQVKSRSRQAQKKGDHPHEDNLHPATGEKRPQGPHAA